MSDMQRHLPGRPARSGDADWRDQAACRGIDPELFFPIGNAGPALLQIGRAKQVCARCPVRMPCLDWALDSGQEAGVWGGTSEEQRRALRPRRMCPASIHADAAHPGCAP
jgi:WhiB family transcriptional regulator, redox-sensing transcriptional regulator